MAQTRKSTKKASAKQSSATKKSAAGSAAATKTTASRGQAQASSARDAASDEATPVAKAARAKAKPKPKEHPDLALARGLAEIITTHALDEIVYDSSELTLTLRRSARTDAVSYSAGHGVAHAVGQAAPPPTVSAAAPVVMAPPQPARDPLAGLARSSIFAEAPPEQAPQLRERSLLAPDGEYHLITSPFVGTFYRRPSPDADTYVTLGSRVAKGQVLCIIEAMKLMNEIESDASGTIADILVEDAQPVEYGQALFKILIS